MAGMVITVAQQKGGAGKTTLATHLAVSLAGRNKSIALVDIDPQGSLSRWFALREERFGEDGPGMTHSQITGWRTQAEVDRLARDHDIVLIDSPPHMETEAKIAIRAARLVIVPVQPSPMDLWATEPTLKLAKSERVPALIVMNRVPPRGKVADQVVDAILEMEAELAETRIGNRMALAAALMEGLGVTEGRRNRAREEIDALTDEVLARLG